MTTPIPTGYALLTAPQKNKNTPQYIFIHVPHTIKKRFPSSPTVSESVPPGAHKSFVHLFKGGGVLRGETPKPPEAKGGVLRGRAPKPPEAKGGVLRGDAPELATPTLRRRRQGRLTKGGEEGTIKGRKRRDRSEKRRNHSGKRPENNT